MERVQSNLEWLNGEVSYSFVFLALLYFILSLTDYTSTIIGIQYFGARELNPFMDWVLSKGYMEAYIVKMVLSIIVILGLGFTYKESRKRSMIVLTVACVVTFLVVVSNVIQLTLAFV